MSGRDDEQLRITDTDTGESWTTTLAEFCADNEDDFEVCQAARNLSSYTGGGTFTTWTGFRIEQVRP